MNNQYRQYIVIDKVKRDDKIIKTIYCLVRGEVKMEKLFLVQQMFATLNATYNKLMTQGDQVWEDLTVKQFMTLLAILHLEEGNATYNRIAEKLGTSKQNTKQLVTSLEKKHFVCIEKHALDKRAVNVVVTKQAKKAMQLGEGEAKRFLERLGEALTLEELEQLWKLLMKLYAFDGTAFNGFEVQVN